MLVKKAFPVVASTRILYTTYLSIKFQNGSCRNIWVMGNNDISIWKTGSEFCEQLLETPWLETSLQSSQALCFQRRCWKCKRWKDRLWTTHHSISHLILKVQVSQTLYEIDCCSSSLVFVQLTSPHLDRDYPYLSVPWNVSQRMYMPEKKSYCF